MVFDIIVVFDGGPWQPGCDDGAHAGDGIDFDMPTQDPDSLRKQGQAQPAGFGGAPHIKSWPLIADLDAGIATVHADANPLRTAARMPPTVCQGFLDHAVSRDFDRHRYGGGWAGQRIFDRHLLPELAFIIMHGTLDGLGHRQLINSRWDAQAGRDFA